MNDNKLKIKDFITIGIFTALMFSCLNIGEELSVATVTPFRRTSPVQLKLKAADRLMIVIFAASVVLFVISKYFR